jgi:cytoskeletal protein CcmA (bactofilin family)
MSLIPRAGKPLVDEHPPAPAGGVNAILGKGASFEGKLVFEGTVHVNGNFTGDIRSPDTLIIGEGAKVQGDVFVGTLIVNGEVSGTLRARTLIQLHAPARVRGTLVTPALVIDRGAVFDGTTQMASAPPEPKADPKAAAPSATTQPVAKA